MSTDISTASATPNHHGMIDPDETLGPTLHQHRAAAIDWSRAPAWATRYAARYDHFKGETTAKWGGPREANTRDEDAPAFFQMGPAERGMVISFGESQGAKEVMPTVTVRHALIEAAPSAGESTVAEIERAIDWSLAPDWATHWFARRYRESVAAHWVSNHDDEEMQHEPAPDFAVTMIKGRALGVPRPAAVVESGK